MAPAEDTTIAPKNIAKNALVPNEHAQDWRYWQVSPLHLWAALHTYTKEQGRLFKGGAVAQLEDTLQDVVRYLLGAGGGGREAGPDLENKNCS